MARIVTSAQLAQGGFGKQDTHYLYNGLDCCITREVADVLQPRLTDVTGRLYNFEMGLQGAAFNMMLRGVLVDEASRLKGIKTLEADEAAEITKCNKLLVEWDGTETITGKCPKGKNHKWPRGVPDSPEKRCEKCNSPRIVPGSLNPLSPLQVKHYFYDICKVSAQRNKTGEVSTDDDCLNRIARKYDKHEPVCGGILAVRGLRKQIGVLNSGVSADGRMRSTFNIGAAWTGRQSSSSNPYDEGTNLQNIADKLRYIFIADPGRELFYADLEQAESCLVAHLAGCEAYIEAHAIGDVHTYVARLLWPDVDWTGDIEQDKAIAKATYYDWSPDKPIRDVAKQIQHGSNYLLSPFGMARIAHLPVAACETAQGRYFDAFPEIRQWQRLTVEEVRSTGVLTSPFGRRCQFFGRLWDDHTHKQGVAFKPQSGVADILNTSMAVIDREMDPGRVWLQAQVHDALLGSVRKGDHDALRQVVDAMKIVSIIEGIDGVKRRMMIGVDCTVGNNWGKASGRNPNGQRKIAL